MHMESSISPGYFNSLQIYEPLLRWARCLSVMSEIVSSVYEVDENIFFVQFRSKRIVLTNEFPPCVLYLFTTQTFLGQLLIWDHKPDQEPLHLGYTPWLLLT